MGRKMASIEAGSLSPSVMSWFGQELEMRGIDAVIYTRYILSILQQEDPGDLDLEAKFFPPLKKQLTPGSVYLEPPAVRLSPAAGSRGRSCSSSGGKGRKTDKKKGITSEELKKLAAVECLLSVSDEVPVLSFPSPQLLALLCIQCATRTSLFRVPASELVLNREL